MLEARHASFSSTTSKCSLKSPGPLPLVPKCCPSAPGTPPAAKSPFGEACWAVCASMQAATHTTGPWTRGKDNTTVRVLHLVLSFFPNLELSGVCAAWSAHLTVGSYLFSPRSLLRSQPQWRWNYLVRNCNIKLLWGSMQVQNMLFFNANFGILIQTQPACIATPQTKNKNDVFKIVCVCAYLNVIQWKKCPPR